MISNYSNKTRRRGKFGTKLVGIIAVVALLVIVGGAFGLTRLYDHSLQPVSASEKSVTFTVPPGATAKEIGSSLKKEGLIRAVWAFEWYVRRESTGGLKAGTYNLRSNLSVPQIVAILAEGEIATDLVTILPGKTLDEIKESLVNKYQFTDASVEAALNPDKYIGHPALMDKPPGASLEGYLYPESFQKTAETTPEDIVRSSLDQMSQALTPEIKTGITNQGLTAYEGIILASLIEQEVSNVGDKRMVAQVFLRRLGENIALRSDPSPYTYEHPGLPPTPLSNVTKSSLEAVANPAPTDFLFFVSGDDGRTHFSHTFEEHEAFTRQYCTRLCQQ